MTYPQLLLHILSTSTPIAPKRPSRASRSARMFASRFALAVARYSGFSDQAVVDVVRILEDAGADMEHTMISHMDVFDYTLETRVKLLEAGCYVGYDNFGNTGYPHLYLGRVVNLMSDFQRIKDIAELRDRGFMEQILLGQDTCFKDQWWSYGEYRQRGSEV